MEQTLNLNQNSTQCIKTISRFGEAVYQNICSGHAITVPWGSLDWVGMVILLIVGSGMAIAMLVGFICLTLGLVRDLTQ